jgi:uncharacterized protein YcbX
LSTSEFVECENNYRGFKESLEINEWLTAIFGEKVFLIKCEKERVMTLDNKIQSQSREDDRRGNYITDGAIHVANTKSILDLKSKVAKKYENTKESYRGENVEPDLFRPNFLIDHDVAYCEEEF